MVYVGFRKHPPSSTVSAKYGEEIWEDIVLICGNKVRISDGKIEIGFLWMFSSHDSFFHGSSVMFDITIQQSAYFGGLKHQNNDCGEVKDHLSHRCWE